MAGPLADLKVIELAGIGPAPHAGMILADLGAEMIRVVRATETRSEHDRISQTDILNRGKRSIGIDLKHPEGVAAVLRLVETAEVLIEGFRPGVTERLGIGPAECLARRPGLVYGRMTGWGQTGPLANVAGHDIDYIAVSGGLAAVGTADEPIPPLNLVGDFGGGSMLLVAGVLAALLHARATGQGQVVDAAMAEGSALLMAMQHGGVAAGWWTDARQSNLFDGGAPFYTTYPTGDAKRMAVGALEPQFYAELLEGLGLGDADLPGQMDRDGWPTLRQRFAQVFVTRSRSEWEAVFEGTDACTVGVYSMTEAPDHPHVRARGAFVDIDGIRQPVPAPRFSRTPADRPQPPPVPGSGTEEVLASLGYDDDHVSRLRSAGVIT